MKSGSLGAEAVFEALKEGKGGEEITSFQERFENSWLYKELFKEHNFGPAMHKFGHIGGGAIAFIEQNILGRPLPMTFHDTVPDYATLKPADQCKKIDYPKPDNTLTFDKLSSVFISNTNHEEDPPIHLKLKDPAIPIEHNLPK